MKLKFLLLLLLPYIALAQTGTYRISGKLGRYDGHNKIYLFHTSTGPAGVDSCVLLDGAFSFSGTVGNPVLANLSLATPGSHIMSIFSPTQTLLYLEPGKITVTSPDSLQHARVEGNRPSEDYQQLRDGLIPLDDQLYAIQNQLFAITDRNAQMEFRKKESGTISALQKSKTEVMKQFIISHPESEVSINVLQTVAGPFPDLARTDSLFQLLSPAVKNSVAGKKMSASLDIIRRTAIGNAAPEFTQADTAGQMISLRSFRGKYVLLDFWASWCVPCRAENPNVVKAYNDYRQKGFTVLSVSLDQAGAKQAWINAIQKDNLTWTQVSDLKYFKNEVAQLYGIQAIPQNFLIDPQGKIVAKNLRGEDLDKKLKEIFQ